MKIIAIIPARMGSSRFPGKPMAKILGIPMVGHVYHRVKQSKSLSDVFVATCDTEIFDYIVSIGGKAIMTADTHERCSDRCAEAMLKAEKQMGEKCDIIVMVQGDEPLTRPEMIDEALEPMKNDPGIKITNLLGKLASVNEFADPNEVKVVIDKDFNALYFSREPIPSVKKIGLKGLEGFYGKSIDELLAHNPSLRKDFQPYKQVCVIPFRRDFLIEFNNLIPTPLEKIESVDMMRILESGMKVKMVSTKFEVKAVDTPADLEKVNCIMDKDPLFQSYRIS